MVKCEVVTGGVLKETKVTAAVEGTPNVILGELHHIVRAVLSDMAEEMGVNYQGLLKVFIEGLKLVEMKGENNENDKNLH